MNEGFSLDFDFSESGLEKLLNDIIQLKEELREAADALINLPLEEVVKKEQQIKIALQGVAESAMKVNQVNKEAGQIFSDLLSEIDLEVEALNKLKTAQQNANKTVQDFQRELNAQDAIIKKTVKSLEEYAVGAYKGKESVEKLQAILISSKSRYEELSSVIKIHNTEIEKEIGYYENLRAVIKELEAERDLLITQGERESSQVEEITSLIQKYNLELQINKRELNGLNEANSLLQKNLEAVVKVTNQDAEAIARVIIEKDKLNKAIEQELVNLGHITDAQQKQLVAAEKAEIAQVKAAVKSAEAEQEKYDKLILSAQKAEVKLLDSEVKKTKRILDEAEKREIAQVKAAVKTAEANEKAANKSVWSWESFTNIFERMGLRMIASLIWWSLIIGAATSLYEWWTKIDDATQRSLDRLKDYFETFNSFQKDKLDSIPKASAKNSFDKQKVDDWFSELTNNPDIEKRFSAYKELQSAFPKIFDVMDKATFKLREHDIVMKQNIVSAERYARTLYELSDAEQKSLSSKELVEKNDNITSVVKSKVLLNLKNNDDKDKIFYAYTGRKDLKNLSDDQIIDALQSSIRGRDKDPNKVERYLKGDIRTNIQILNSLDDEQNQNKLDDEYYSKLVSDLRHKKLQEEGNEKDSKGSRSGPNILHEIIRNRQSSFNDQSKKNTEDYQSNEPSNTYENDLGYHEKQISEGIKHYDELLKFIKDHRSLDKADNEEYTKHFTDLSAKRTELINKETKAISDIKEEEKRRFDTSIKQIDDFQRKIDDLNEKLGRQLSKYQKDKKQNLDKEQSAGRVNPLLAAFGVEDSYSNFQDNQRRIQQDADEKQKEIDSSNKRRSDLVIQRSSYDDNLSKAGIEFKDGNPVDPNKAAFTISQDKSGFLQKQFDEHKKITEDIKSYYDKIVQDTDSRDNLLSEKSINEKKLKAEGEKELYKKTFDYSIKLMDDQMSLQKKRIQQELTDLQARYSFEMLLAGNNSAGKIRLAQREHEESLALRRKEAQLEKGEAIFSALMNVTKGELEILGKYGATPIGIALMALTAAMGLEDVAVISNTPLPQYKRGRRGGKREMARINEENRTEIVEDKYGKYKVFGGGMDTIANLSEGDTVHTHEESLKIAEKSKYAKSLLKGTGIIEKREDIRKHERYSSYFGISKEDMQDVMDKSIKKIPQPIFNQPASGVQERLIKQQLRNGI